MARDWLEELEASLGNEEGDLDLATAVVMLAALAGDNVELLEDDVRAASRRALLLLAAGGDPARGLDLNGRAVDSVALDLDAPDRRQALLSGLDRIREKAVGLAHVSEALRAMIESPDVAWRAFACSLLAEELADED